MAKEVTVYNNDVDYQSSLAYEFRNVVAKDKDLRMSSEAKIDIGYPTGFLGFDFMNGYKVHNNGETKYNLGISDGSMVMVIGRSGCGKSTFCTQMAANIVRPFKTSTIFEDSIEGGMVKERRMQLSGFNTEAEYKKRFVIRNTGITAETFLARIKFIHDLKLADPERYKYDTGYVDEEGNPIKLFEPTVYILDSIALIMPDDLVEEGEVSTNMSVTRTAKVVTDIIRRVVPMLKMANIILIVVNHILSDVSIRPKKADLMYLKQGESLPRGKTVIYLSNTVIRLDDTKLKADEKFKVAGSLVDVTNTKSRSAGAGQTSTMVFTYDHGFDPELSLFMLLQNNGRVNGAGIGYYFDDHTDFKFSLKGFKDKLRKDPDFYKLFMEVAKSELEKLPSNANDIVDVDDQDQNESNNVTSDILGTIGIKY